MHAWEAIQTAVDEIEAHLFEEMKTQDLADQVSLSSFYFQKLFKRLVGKSPQEYIQLRRLAKAAEALKQQDCRIVDLWIFQPRPFHLSFQGGVWTDTFCLPTKSTSAEYVDQTRDCFSLSASR